MKLGLVQKIVGRHALYHGQLKCVYEMLRDTFFPVVWETVTYPNSCWQRDLKKLPNFNYQCTCNAVDYFSSTLAIEL